MKNKIYYLFLCLCLVCTAPFLTSCSDDDDSSNNSGEKNEVGNMVGQWISTTVEEWKQIPGSSTYVDYQKEIFTMTLTLNADGTGSLVEEDGDRNNFEWQCNSSADVLILNYEFGDPDTIRITWQNSSKFTWLETRPSYEEAYGNRYIQYIFTRLK